MATLGDLERAGVINGLRNLGVASVNVLEDHIIAAINQIPSGPEGDTSVGDAEVVEEV